MNLSNLQLNETSFLHLERYVNNGSPSGFTSKYATSAQTSPFGPCENFHLCAMEFPESIEVLNFGKEPKFFEKWQMLVHPDMIDDPLFAVCTNIERNSALVAPTASGRTVKMLEGDGWFLKLCYKGLIGRIDRQLGTDHACSAIEVSDTIEAAIKAGSLPKTFGIFRESFGRVIKLPDNDSTYDWGIVLREPLPFPATPDARALVPGFALFAEDRKHPGQKTILTQLISAQSKPVSDFLFEDLIAPVFDAYFSLLLQCGLQLEAQAQNILFMLDSNLRIASVVARDAESVDKDFSLMDELGIAHDFTSREYKSLYRDQYNYQIMHSFMFDFKLGEYLIKPIISNAAENFSFDQNALEERIRSHNRDYIKKLPPDFFPADGQWYSYANEVHDRTKARPYIATPNPKYR